VGIEVWGDFADGAFSYAVGVFNGAGDTRNPGATMLDDDKQFAAGLRLQPFRGSGLRGMRGIGFGVGGSYSQVNSNALGLPSTTGGTLPGYATSGLQQFFAYNPLVGPVVADGPHWRISPNISYLYGPFGLLGEYGISHQGVYNSTTFRAAALQHKAWQVVGQWVLTGEPASFTGIKPNRPFDPRNGGWGAWQLVGRLSQLKIDDEAFNGFSDPTTSASGAFTWSVGLNWWLNRNLRVLTSFSHTRFDGGGLVDPNIPGTLNPPGAVTHQDEQVFMTRFQLAF
jgi:phosphate-selective porin OprO/OprP